MFNHNITEQVFVIVSSFCCNTLADGSQPARMESGNEYKAPQNNVSSPSGGGGGGMR
jgi:hypothetical protein